MKLTRVKKWLVAALIAEGGGMAFAADMPEEEIVDFDESEFWLGGDEVVVATGEGELWLGPYEIAVATGAGEFWLGPDEIAVAKGEKEFALVVFRALLSNDDIANALRASGAVDKKRICELIGSSPDAYRAFKQWAESLGDIDVAASSYAGDSFAFGVEELFKNVPEVRFTDISVATRASGTFDVTVTVNDGGMPKLISSANVVQMLEATIDVSDWAYGRVEVDVVDRTKKVSTQVEFTIKLGDGTVEKAFFRIRK